MDIEYIMDRAQKQAIKSGFVRAGQKRPIAEHAALIHSEVSEMFEAWRDHSLIARNSYEHTDASGKKVYRRTADPLAEGFGPGKPVGIPSELADIVIRCCQMAAELNIELPKFIKEKMDFNATRSYQHGGKRA
jgi:NTP pyrophosphatase (non-canonical NTP hydrolase)